MKTPMKIPMLGAVVAAIALGGLAGACLPAGAEADDPPTAAQTPREAASSPRPDAQRGPEAPEVSPPLGR
jgi:hypothetical protein